MIEQPPPSGGCLTAAVLILVIPVALLLGCGVLAAFLAIIIPTPGGQADPTKPKTLKPFTSLPTDPPSTPIQEALNKKHEGLTLRVSGRCHLVINPNIHGKAVLLFPNLKGGTIGLAGITTLGPLDPTRHSGKPLDVVLSAKIVETKDEAGNFVFGLREGTILRATPIDD